VGIDQKPFLAYGLPNFGSKLASSSLWRRMEKKPFFPFVKKHFKKSRALIIYALLLGF